MTGWPGIEAGTAIPPLVRAIGLPDMIAYAGATWDWHRLHYDRDYLASRKLSRPVVDGQLFGALLVELVQDWLGPEAFVCQLDFRLAGLVFAGETVRCEGEVVQVTPDTITAALRTIVTGSQERVAVSAASAVVRRYG